ncbi:MAG: heparinase II/III family protein [Pseudomonadota bacterium]
MLLSQYIDKVRNQITEDKKLESEFFSTSSQVLEGNIQVYDRLVDLGDQLDWNRDITASTSWPIRFFKNYRSLVRGRRGNHGDFRFTWELSRQQHLLGLAIAYRITGEEKYADCVMKHLTSWIDKSPPFWSLNWISSMEVGLRMVTWAIALGVLAGSPALTQNQHKIIVCIYQHMRFLRENLSVALDDAGGATKLKNNHTIVELASLLVACEFFPQLARASQIDSEKHALLKSLLDELHRQTFSDGMHVEQASSYLRFVIESLLVTRLTVSGTEDLDHYIHQYMNAINAFRFDDHKIFLVGDEDNGHVLLPFFESLPDCTRVIAGMYSILLQSSENTELLSGQTTGWSSLAHRDTALTASGHWIARAQVKDVDLAVYFRAGRMDFPTIPGYAPHVHCDLLSMDFALDNQLWLVDRGTYSYVERKAADELRSGTGHNIVSVDGFEQMTLLGAFNGKDHSIAEILQVKPRAVSGRLNLDNKERTVTINRSITVSPERGEITIEDTVDGLLDDTVEWLLNLHPEVKADDDRVLSRPGSPLRVALKGWEDASIKDVYYSPRYGVRQRSSQLVLSHSAQGNLSKKWSISLIA